MSKMWKISFIRYALPKSDAYKSPLEIDETIIFIEKVLRIVIFRLVCFFLLPFHFAFVVGNMKFRRKFRSFIDRRWMTIGQTSPTCILYGYYLSCYFFFCERRWMGRLTKWLTQNSVVQTVLNITRIQYEAVLIIVTIMTHATDSLFGIVPRCRL